MKFPFLPVAIWSTGCFLIWHPQGDLNPDPLYSWYHFSHPPLVLFSALECRDDVLILFYSEKNIMLLFDCCSFLHTVQLHHSASFCIKSIPCASCVDCVDMLTHVAFGGRAASYPEGHRSGIGKEGLVGKWTRWTKRCCPKWCQNLSQTLPRPKKSLQSLDHVGPCWTEPQGPRPARPARCSVDLCFSVSHCHCTQISRTCEAWQSFNSRSANPWLLCLLSGSDLHESQVMVINSHSHY